MTSPRWCLLPVFPLSGGGRTILSGADTKSKRAIVFSIPVILTPLISMSHIKHKLNSVHPLLKIIQWLFTDELIKNNKYQGVPAEITFGQSHPTSLSYSLGCRNMTLFQEQKALHVLSLSQDMSFHPFWKTPHFFSVTVIQPSIVSPSMSPVKTFLFPQTKSGLCLMCTSGTPLGQSALLYCHISLMLVNYLIDVYFLTGL